MFGKRSDETRATPGLPPTGQPMVAPAALSAPGAAIPDLPLQGGFGNQSARPAGQAGSAGQANPVQAQAAKKPEAEAAAAAAAAEAVAAEAAVV